jgi:hypothetical protein
MLKSAHVYHRDYKETLKMRKYFAVAAAVAMVPLAANANPYASNVSITGTTVSFILNESADSLTYSINGGPAVALDGSTKGAKTFNLTSPSDTFSISTAKVDTGYTTLTGSTIATDANGLQATSNAGTFKLISSDSNNLVKFNSPRGVDVAKNPNNPNFGTAYIGNSASGSVGGRSLGDGLYAIRADQTDAFGYGNTAQTAGITAWGTSPSTSAPFRTHVGSDGNVYIADFSDATGNVWRMAGNLTAPAAGTQVLTTVGGPSTPTGQNHGSTTAVYTEGTGAGLVMYTVDEDLTDAIFGGANASNKNSLWKYTIGNTVGPYSGNPTRVNVSTSNPQALIPLATSDMDRGKDGKFYLAQNRGSSSNQEPALIVLDSDGTYLYDSLTASRDLLGNPTAGDILRNAQGMAVSPDQNYVALMLNNSDVAVVPLIDGIPDITQRIVVDTGTNANSGRDIAFDAADNIWYVSSGQGLLRVLSPGGTQMTTLTWDGSSYSFEASVPEPGTLALVVFGAIPLLQGRRRRSRS